jgi:hypothetical protein
VASFLILLERFFDKEEFPLEFVGPIHKTSKDSLQDKHLYSIVVCGSTGWKTWRKKT